MRKRASRTKSVALRLQQTESKGLPGQCAACTDDRPISRSRTGTATMIKSRVRSTTRCFAVNQLVLLMSLSLSLSVVRCLPHDGAPSGAKQELNAPEPGAPRGFADQGPESGEWLQSELVAAKRRAKKLGAMVQRHVVGAGAWAATSAAGVLAGDGVNPLVGDALKAVSGSWERFKQTEAVRWARENFIPQALGHLSHIMEEGSILGRRIDEKAEKAMRWVLSNVLLPSLDLAWRAGREMLAMLRWFAAQMAIVLEGASEQASKIATVVSAESGVIWSKTSLLAGHWSLNASKVLGQTSEWIVAASMGIASSPLFARAYNATVASTNQWARIAVDAKNAIIAAAQRVFHVHKRLIMWYWNHPPPIYFMARKAFRLFFGSPLSTYSKGTPAKELNEEEPSAWWAGPSAGETGTTSWRELVNVMGSWSSPTAEHSAGAEEEPKLKVDEAVPKIDAPWFITIDSSGPSPEGVTRYIVLHHGQEGGFLLLSEDSNGWFRYAKGQSSSIVYPSGLTQPADHSDAAELVGILKGKHGERPMIKIVGRKSKQIGNWHFQRVGKAGSAILVTNTVHIERQGTPRLILTRQGMLYVGEKSGLQEGILGVESMAVSRAVAESKLNELINA